jgi:hypothetical protein
MTLVQVNAPTIAFKFVNIRILTILREQPGGDVLTAAQTWPLAADNVS